MTYSINGATSQHSDVRSEAKSFLVIPNMLFRNDKNLSVNTTAGTNTDDRIVVAPMQLELLNLPESFSKTIAEATGLFKCVSVRYQFFCFTFFFVSVYVPNLLIL